LALVFPLLSTPVFAEKSYSIPSVNIEAEIDWDGSMKVKEERQYSFNGDYSFAYLEILKTQSR
jgi:hypothetical protein